MRIRSLSTALMCVALMATTGSSLFAQISPGARIRVRFDTAPRKTLIGTVDSIWGDSIRVRTDTVVEVVTGIAGPTKTVTVPLATISSLELSTGRHSLGRRGANIGGVVGLLTGVVVGVSAGGKKRCDNDPLNWCETGRVFEGFAYACVGALAGAGTGWLVGTQIHADTWKPVPVPRLQIAPVSSSDIGITVSFRF